MVDDEWMRPDEWFGLLSVLCHCGMGDRKDIWPIKTNY